MWTSHPQTVCLFSVSYSSTDVPSLPSEWISSNFLSIIDVEVFSCPSSYLTVLYVLQNYIWFLFRYVEVVGGGAGGGAGEGLRWRRWMRFPCSPQNRRSYLGARRRLHSPPPLQAMRLERTSFFLKKKST